MNEYELAAALNYTHELLAQDDIRFALAITSGSRADVDDQVGYLMSRMQAAFPDDPTLVREFGRKLRKSGLNAKAKATDLQNKMTPSRRNKHAR
jgi:hypothetical protein